MRLPQQAPTLPDLVHGLADERLQAILAAGIGSSVEGRYLHWDEIRHRQPPLDLNVSECLEREADRSKDVGAQRWIAAVNHWGKLGRWRYAKLHSPHDLVSVLGGDPGPEADHEARA